MAGKGTASGFTLIELSIVLVIIGLIVGGILVGQDMIKAAEVRAQITQIEKYNQAINTFRTKFGAIPGDMAVSTAQQFGFTLGPGCNGAQGQRDGNGLIDGWSANVGWTYFQVGETSLFWQDLSSPAGGTLIEGQFPNSGATTPSCASGPGVAWSTTPGITYIGDYLPSAKIGHGNFIYVYEASGYNWYALSAVTSTDSNGNPIANATLPVVQTYNIDKKIDDGLPVTGAERAVYLNAPGSATAPIPAPTAAADNTTSCYNSTSNAYSISSYANYGAGGNCALSFRFQ